MAAFLAPIAGMLAGKLFDKFVKFNNGGQVRVKGGRGGLAVLHNGEMVVKKALVERTKAAMKEKGIPVPKPRTIKGIARRRALK